MRWCGRGSFSDVFIRILARIHRIRVTEHLGPGPGWTEAEKCCEMRRTPLRRPRSHTPRRPTRSVCATPETTSGSEVHLQVAKKENPLRRLTQELYPPSDQAERCKLKHIRDVISQKIQLFLYSSGEAVTEQGPAGYEGNEDPSPSSCGKSVKSGKKLCRLTLARVSTVEPT